MQHHVIVPQANDHDAVMYNPMKGNDRRPVTGPGRVGLSTAFLVSS